MASIHIDEEIYEQWKDFYSNHKGLDYPTLKNFTEKMMVMLMKASQTKEARRATQNDGRQSNMEG